MNLFGLSFVLFTNYLSLFTLKYRTKKHFWAPILSGQTGIPTSKSLWIRLCFNSMPNGYLDAMRVLVKVLKPCFSYLK